MATWTLWANSDLVGEIRGVQPDQPWFVGTWHPRDSFQPYGSLFAEELSLVDSLDDRWDEWERCYRQIWNALSLKTPDKIDVPEWILHVDGVDAWFRYQLEPFEPDP